MKPVSVLTDYFYGDEAEQFTYFRIPRLLITSPRFKGVSTEAKLLYGMMLDRMGLSMKNGWHEADGRVYIYYTLEEICGDLNCGHEKAVKLVAELDGGKGIGLIDRKRQGQGKPTKIYVKRFTTTEVPPRKEPKKVAASEPDARLVPVQTSDTPNSRLPKVGSPDFGKPEVWTSENPNSRLPKNGNPDFGKTDASYPDNSKLDFSNPYSVNPSIPASSGFPALARAGVGDGQTDGQAVRERIKKQIDYDFLPFRLNGWELKQADELLELMVEVAMNRSPTMKIGRDEFVTPYVQERFQCITIEHIEQVLQALRENEGRVTNVKAYLLASLFNAAATGYNVTSLSVDAS